MNIFPRPKLFFVSPWLLAAATALLVLIVVTFTLSNIRREEQLMTESMLQKADTLIRVLHSGSRSAYFADLRRGEWETDPWSEYVQRVINHIAEDPEVTFLAVVDDSSKVIAHNKEEEIGQTLDYKLPKKPPEGKGSIPPIGFRIVEPDHKGRIFEAVRQFYPYQTFLSDRPRSFQNRRKGRLFFGQRGIMYKPPPQEKVAPGMNDRTFYVLVGLDMSSYDKSLRRIKLQTLLLSLIMLLVGLGGWFSLAAVQGYRVSQRTLGEMKNFTNLLLAKLPVGIIATDREGNITTFNDTAAAMTGMTSEEVFGKDAVQFLPESFAGCFADGSTPDNTKPQMKGGEKEITVPVEGRTCHYLCHVIDVGNDPTVQQGRVLLVSDLTELKGLEREMRENERMAAVGRMAAGVAHEVRNPLSSIKGLALLLKGKFTNDSSGIETAELLIEQVERMNRTVSELLSFARPAPLKLQRVVLKDLLADILRLIEADAANLGVETRLEAAQDLQAIAADPDRLNQVFINLLLNSLQAMEGGGELVVTAENSHENNTVVVKIHDTGCGIPQENVSQLFYPYFTTKPGGTGIGLAISQKIVSDHKGTIRVESTEGKETTVTLEFPVYRKEADSQS